MRADILLILWSLAFVGAGAHQCDCNQRSPNGDALPNEGTPTSCNCSKKDLQPLLDSANDPGVEKGGSQEWTWGSQLKRRMFSPTRAQPATNQPHIHGILNRTVPQDFFLSLLQNMLPHDRYKKTHLELEQKSFNELKENETHKGIDGESLLEGSDEANENKSNLIAMTKAPIVKETLNQNLKCLRLQLALLSYKETVQQKSTLQSNTEKRKNIDELIKEIKTKCKHSESTIQKNINRDARFGYRTTPTEGSEEILNKAGVANFHGDFIDEVENSYPKVLLSEVDRNLTKDKASTKANGGMNVEKYQTPNFSGNDPFELSGITNVTKTILFSYNNHTAPLLMISNKDGTINIHINGDYICKTLKYNPLRYDSMFYLLCIGM